MFHYLRFINKSNRFSLCFYCLIRASTPYDWVQSAPMLLDSGRYQVVMLKARLWLLTKFFTRSVHDRRGSIKGQYQIFLFKVYLVSNTEIRPVGEFIVQKYSRRWLSSFVFIFGLAITPLYSSHLSYRLSVET